MKICYICIDPGIPVFGRKGCSTHVRETCKALKSAGHEVFVVTTNKGDDECEFGGIPIYEAPVYRSKKAGSDTRLVVNSFRAIRLLKDIMRKERPDAIYERHSLYNFVGTWLSKSHKIPRILESNTFLVVEQGNRIHFPSLATLVENYVLKHSPHIIVVSPPLKESYIELGIPENKITIMPMAVDVDMFKPETDGHRIRKELDVEGKTVVGYVGTLTGWHGISYILECGRIVKEKNKSIVFLVVGGHEKKVAQFRQKVRQASLEDTVFFVGSAPYSQIPEYVSAMDITLVPNSTQWASPTKIFEYQSMAKPIVAPSLVPVREVIEHGEEGFLFQPDNTDEMVEEILKLHDDPELRRRMGECGRRRVILNHSWQVNTKRIVEIFENMLSEKVD